MIDAPSGEIPEVEIGGTDPISARINGSAINPNSEDLLGFVQTPQGQHILLVFYDPATNTDYIFQIGGNPVSIPTNLAQYNALNNSITNGGIAGGPFAPGQNILVSSFLNVDIDNSPVGQNIINGTNGDDFLQGTAAASSGKTCRLRS